MDVLPDELLLVIGCYLDKCSKVTYTLTCRRFKNVCYKLIPKEFLTKTCELIDYAIIYEYINLIKWFRNYNIPYDKDVWIWASTCNIEMLKFLENDGLEPNKFVASYAIETGNHEMVKYCHYNNYPGYES